MSDKVDLNLESLTAAFAVALAAGLPPSEGQQGILALAAETQPGAKWRVFSGFDLAVEKADTPTPSLIILPQADEEQADGSRTLSVVMDLRLKDFRRSSPGMDGALVAYGAPSVAMRWVDAIRATLMARISGTDAKLLYLSARYDFTSFAAEGLVMASIVASVPLSRAIGGRARRI